MPEILGIGSDVEDISRFHKHITGSNAVSTLISDLFTKEEIRLNLSFKNPYLCFALGFSCKESVFKALGKSWMNAPVTWNEIECLFSAEPGTGKHEIRLSGDVSRMLDELGGKEIESDYTVREDHVIFHIIIWK